MTTDMTFEHLLVKSAESLTPQHKTYMMLAGLLELTSHHQRKCPHYTKILQGLEFSSKNCISIEDVPFLPVNLFKKFQLHSLSYPDQIIKTLVSSSTSGNAPSMISIDHETGTRQVRALNKTLQRILGNRRLPMLILDMSSVIRSVPLTARGAGVLGMMRFGHAHCFAFDERMQLQEKEIESFLTKNSNNPFLLFGFTFIAWEYFLQQCPTSWDLGQGVLIHSGGWKKMQSQAVSPDTFKKTFQQKIGLKKIYNFYGLVEQIGSIFLEQENGLLAPPPFSDVIIRDPFTLAPLPYGKEGLIQLLSLVPKSYPGHSILTSDMGVLHPSEIINGSPHCLEVTRRAPMAEIRGCSDTAPNRSELANES
ncbi:hypothetical protein [Kiloniella laminariae]|uniref:LuxE/PaaK family acyltransferase n=1 Tax=Kiloniella laminariae TaxID=454162 RepID=UPI0003601219|nr:hypothetical protein [Kiloniella laminariae]